LDDNDGIVRGLNRLRELSRSERAIGAVLAVPEVKRARLSWALWEALVAGHGDEPDRLLLGRIPIAVLDSARVALWGDTSSSAERDRLFVVKSD
jgi:hypothetical protein